MRKKLVSFALSASLIFSTSLVASAAGDDKEAPKNLQVGKSNSKELLTKSQQTSFTFEVGKNIAPEVQKEIAPGNKISKYVLEKIKEIGTDTPVNVRVGTTYEHKIQSFLSKEQSAIKADSSALKIDSEYTFVANLTGKQITALAESNEVFWISLATEVATVSDEDLPDTVITPYLNASTEMTGAKKARQDFGVTGNRSGSETTYSADDVVIAVIDTGIDASHVDLDGGKVIGWNDLIHNQTTPYDNHGHGTHVASIAAGTGEGDPGIQSGYAPGAALVGVRVFDDSWGASVQNIANAINWIVNNNNTLGVEIINFSIQGFGIDETPVSNAIANARNNGIITVVATGNIDNAPFAQYNSLSDYATISTALTVGNTADPYEGGWYPNKTSRRGTGTGATTTGPYVVAPGTNIRAAAANTTNGYTTMSGTSMSTPAVAGILALMNDASNGSVSYSIATEEFGESGFDPVTGHGEILAYESIKKCWWLFKWFL